MTTIDIHNFKGTELVEEFTDFVITGALEAKAIASKDTGRMVGSVNIKKVPDGFMVYSDSSHFIPKSKGGDGYYTRVYVEKGYPPKWGPFDFFYEGFMNIGEGELVKGSTLGYTARNNRWGRRGSGSASLSGSAKASVTAYLQKAGTKLSLKVPKRLVK